MYSRLSLVDVSMPFSSTLLRLADFACSSVTLQLFISVWLIMLEVQLKIGGILSRNSKTTFLTIVIGNKANACHPQNSENVCEWPFHTSRKLFNQTSHYVALQFSIYTVSQKKGPTLKLSVTLSNLNRFSKSLHYWKAYKIRYKTNTKLPTSP